MAMKKLAVILTLCAAFAGCGPPPSSQDTPLESPSVEEKEARALVESFLAIKPGMTVEEFRRVSPDAKRALMDADRETGLRPDGSQGFLEVRQEPRGPLLKLSSRYEFEDGRLVLADILFGGNRLEMLGLLSALVDTCEDDFGHPFSAQVALERQAEGGQLQRPVFLWQNREVILSVKYSKSHGRGRIQGSELDWIGAFIRAANADEPRTFPQVDVTDSAKRALFREDLGIELP